MLHTSKDIRNPGLRTLPPGVERFFVKGGGLSVIEVQPEDKIEIINDEGMQLCEIIVFNSKGKPDLSILSLKENSNADFSKRVISNDEKISKLFKKKNQDYGDAFANYGPVGVIVRMGDKIQRLQSITKNGVSFVKEESIRDTLIDLHNYAAMAVMLMDEKASDAVSGAGIHEDLNR